MQGNTLSYLYSVEWPAFAVVAGIGWWQMFHDTPDDIAARKAHHARARAASAEVVARTLPRAALAITIGSGGTPPELTPGGDDRAPVPAGFWDSVADDRGGAPSSSASGDTGLLADEDTPTDQLTAYNRYLAMLAVRGKPKTWRNPRGI
jgi:hypothetical protein